MLCRMRWCFNPWFSGRGGVNSLPWIAQLFMARCFNPWFSGRGGVNSYLSRPCPPSSHVSILGLVEGGG